MVIADVHTILSTEPYTMPRVWGDVREDGKYQLVWEFKNWENELASDSEDWRESSYWG